MIGLGSSVKGGLAVALFIGVVGCEADTKPVADTVSVDSVDTANTADTATVDSADTVDTTADVVAPVDPKCAPILDGCLTRQRTCVVENDEAKCRACPAGQFPARDNGACKPLPGLATVHDFGTQTITSGQEIGSLCQTWILDNDQELWVNAVEMDNDGGYHHSNWFFVPENYQNWPTGPWVDCYSEGFHEIDAALAGGVLYAQSTQVKRELQKFQAGAAVRIPPRSRIITVTHLLNYLPDTLTTGLRLTIHTLPRAEVVTPLSPGQLVYSDLAIPGKATSTFGGTCDMATTYASLFDGKPLDVKLHYVLPHYHDLGDGFEVRLVGGPRDGEKIVDLGSYSTDPFGFAFDPPIDMTGATGLSFKCRYRNPRDATVHWGIGDQEMCEALLFFESPMAFTAGVTKTLSETTVPDGEDAGVREFTGECGVIGFPFDPKGN